MEQVPKFHFLNLKAKKRTLMTRRYNNNLIGQPCRKKATHTRALLADAQFWFEQNTDPNIKILSFIQHIFQKI